MRRLTLDAIQLIDMIAKTGSFTAAAEKLHKVPSTVSYSINKLEEQMDVRFFERNGPRVALTALGQALLEDGRCLLASANDLEAKLRKMSQGVETELTITLDALLPLAAFAPDIHVFLQSESATQLHFQQEVLTGTWEALMQRRADLVIAGGNGPAGGGYKTFPVGTISFVFCVAPHHPLAESQEPLQKSQLLQHNAISIADSARHLPLRTTGLYSGQKQITVSTLADKIALQKAGLGHGFLPQICVKKDLENRELIALEVAEPKADETYYLAWRTDDSGLALNWWIQRLSWLWLPQLLENVTS